MWFLYVGVGLALLVVAGLYTRRRLAGALRHFGVGERSIRIARWAIGWLLFGYPIVLVVTIIVTLILGNTTMPRYDGMVAAWLLGFPFAWAVLIVFQSVPWLLVSEVVHAIVRRRRGDATAARVRAVAVLIVVGAFAIYTPVRILVERGDLRVRHHQLGDADAPPFRIAFVADVQQDEHTDAGAARAVYARINDAAPDLILSGGDWINTGPEHIEAAAATAGMLSARHGVLSVRGDHEHFAYFDQDRSVAEVEAALARHGIAMLDDQVRWFEHAGKRIGVALLNHNYIHRTDGASVERLVGELAGADYAILVTHQLDRALADRLEGRVDLVLAAHTHGGQVNPVIGLTHVNLASIETPLVDGRYQLGARTTVIVTAGVGYSIIPIRYASPGSIEIIDLAL